MCQGIVGKPNNIKIIFKIMKTNKEKLISFLESAVVWWGFLYADKLFINIIAGFVLLLYGVALLLDFYKIFLSYKIKVILAKSNANQED